MKATKLRRCTIRSLLSSLLLLLPFQLPASPPPGYLPRLADAVYWAEGGTKASHPYGLVFYKVPTNKYREICLSHLAAYYAKWEKTEADKDFVAWLGARWSPTAGVSASDAKANKNWYKNVSFFLRHPKPAP